MSSPHARLTKFVTRLGANPVDNYAQDIVDGRLPAGRYHFLSCQRHLRDRTREADPKFPFFFSWQHADQFINFCAQLRHYTGEQFAGKPITLSPVQVFRLGSIFGWRQKNTLRRRFTTAYNELPRKSGKTLEGAIVALYVTFFEGEPGASGFTIATKREQAKLVFDAARQLVRSSGLRSRIAVLTNNLHRQQYNQKLEPLGADADSTDGLNPYLIITDEFHAHKNRKLVDVMESATGARQTFLHFIITTAGDDPISPCGDEHDFACRILDGVLGDNEATHAYFAFIAHADKDDDWKVEATWRKANPHYGISVNPEDLRKQALAAIAVPQKAAEFQQKRLNLWVNRKQPSMSVDGWRAGQSQWTIQDMAHQPCMLGLDMSAKIDLAALTALFPPTASRPKWRLAQWIWTPADTLIDRAHRDRAPYPVWVQQGWLIATPGTSISQRTIHDKIREVKKLFDVHLLGYDPWHVDKLIEDLREQDGWDERHLIEVPQTFAALTSTETRFKADVLAGLVDARYCPVTEWAVSNVVDQTDGKGNILFSKKHSRGRIDPVKSATIAMSLQLRQPIPREKDYQVMIFGGPPR